jgi:hypothetical protein
MSRFDHTEQNRGGGGAGIREPIVTKYVQSFAEFWAAIASE